MGLTRPPAEITARPPEQPGWCTLCGTRKRAVQADWEIAFAGGATGMMSCADDLGESVAMVMNSQSADHVTVYDVRPRTG